MQNAAPQLTICSVYHSDMTRRILEMNAEFIHTMNPVDSWVHLAMNNSPEQSIHTVSARVRELPGAAIPPTAPSYGFVGYHEGAGLNMAIPHVKTRFAVFLDHDFFIVRPNWINDTIAYMKEKDIAILAAPYHPKYWAKFRYGAGAYCIFVDREKIGDDFLTLDFKPQYSEEHLRKGEESSARKTAWRARQTKEPSWLNRFWGNIKKRRYIGKSQDVSYDLYRRYHNHPTIRTECFAPTVVLHDFLTHYYVDKRWYPLLYRLERLIPERWSFVPKRKGYFTFTRFKDLGFFDVLGGGMEEYFWRGEPFAFHLRGFKERTIKERGDAFNPEESIALVRTATESFVRSKHQ